MKILLTGATGFIGSYILKELVRKGHEVKCLMRDISRNLAIDSVQISKVAGDVLDPTSLKEAVGDCQGVIHLVGIIDEFPKKGITFDSIHRGGTANIVEASISAGVSRFVQMSANGADPNGVSNYLTSKWDAEQVVQKSGFRHFVIIRPSLVFGNPEPGQPEFCSRLASTLISKFPILPVFGDGKYRMQPIHVHEVAAAFVQALEDDKHNGLTYVAVGKKSYSYLEILDIIAAGMGLSPKKKVHQPIWLVRPMIKRLSGTGALPISIDQFEMLLEGNTGSADEFYSSFDVEAIPFDSDSLSYLQN